MKIDNHDYCKLLSEIKSRIKSSQIKAAIHVNKELLQLYWYIGKRIVEKQKLSKWGDKFLSNLSRDLSKEFPAIKGFSKRNLELIRQWYNFWNSDNEIAKQVVSQLGNLFQIPWGHNIVIVSKCKNYSEACYYLKNTLLNNWSRNILIHQIESKLYNRDGKSVTNFSLTLAKPHSDLAKESLKDPYIFDFLDLTNKFNEKDLENNLIENITNFLLELGSGFSYVGKQYHIELEGEDYYIDLLFYHLNLRCYIAIELKIGDFKPEYVGKMNFYLTILDNCLKKESDNPSLGLILCKNRKRITAEYALRNFNRPIAVSEYNLPSKNRIEQELNKKIESKTQNVN
ncbi:MAG: PDDEXK nuclease domain-containing protein [Candidatus Woesearchaeota archaeon]